MSKYFLDEYLKKIRSEKNLTQKEMADQIGIGFSTYRLSERGKTDFPNDKFISKISNFLGVSKMSVISDILYFPWKDYLFSTAYLFNIDKELYTDHGIRYNYEGASMALYTAQLVLEGWQIVEPIICIETKRNPYYLMSFYDLSLRNIVDNNGLFYPKSIGFPYENEGRMTFLGYGSCLRISHNPTNVVIPFVCDDFPCSISNDNYAPFSYVAKAIVTNFNKLFPKISDAKPLVAFTMSLSENHLESLLSEGCISRNINKHSNFFFAIYDGKTNSYLKYYPTR